MNLAHIRASLINFYIFRVSSILFIISPLSLGTSLILRLGFRCKALFLDHSSACDLDHLLSGEFAASLHLSSASFLTSSQHINLFILPGVWGWECFIILPLCLLKLDFPSFKSLSILLANSQQRRPTNNTVWFPISRAYPGPKSHSVAFCTVSFYFWPLII